MPTLTRADQDSAFLRASERPVPPDAGAREIGIVDLFSGCGGLTVGAIEGARRRGVRAELRLAVDKWAPALEVMQCSLDLDDERIRVADVGQAFGVGGFTPDLETRTLLEAAAPGVQLLLAGPPCQGHSALNNHTRHDDDRNELYVAMADAAELLKPDAVIIENVRGIARDRRGAPRCEARLTVVLRGEGQSR